MKPTGSPSTATWYVAGLSSSEPALIVVVLSVETDCRVARATRASSSPTVNGSTISSSAAASPPQLRELLGRRDEQQADVRQLLARVQPVDEVVSRRLVRAEHDDREHRPAERGSVGRRRTSAWPGPR